MPEEPGEVEDVHCPICNEPCSRVVDSRSKPGQVRRRRECKRCKARFTTYEQAQASAPMVRKRDGSPEKFDRDKVASGIRKACAKRPVPGRVIEKLVQDIEDMVTESPEQEVTSQAIGQMITGRLMDVDEIAYLRWSSVYQDFRDVESFRKALEDLENPEGMGTEERPTALAET